MMGLVHQVDDVSVPFNGPSAPVLLLSEVAGRPGRRGQKDGIGAPRLGRRRGASATSGPGPLECTSTSTLSRRRPAMTLI
ncbi:protein of unknown function [Streptomyces sp. KY75]|nr:protein of unknown function [Streptomyces sp. KY70]CAD5988437.1 protein of unknown function [Streptomyces sp. KY75]